MTKEYGPTLPISKWVYDEKYLSNETFKEGMTRLADTLKDSPEHFEAFRSILYDQRFLPGGRVVSSIGSPRITTAFNCYVMDTIPDSMEGIMRVLGEAAETMRLGGGVGYDFSTLRPRGAPIKSLDSQSSGPLSFMDVFDALCKCIMSAGHRRGAQMGVLRVDHPDIEEFVEAKANGTRLRNFNISVAVTDDFMTAVKDNTTFDLIFEDRVYKTINARPLWKKILRSNWDWAEPGVLFIDRINKKNNLWYCEEICATNPCAEQPLPPYGACLLGSFNLVKYIETFDSLVTGKGFVFDWDQLYQDIPHVVRAMDNVFENSFYPLKEQAEEAMNKRRMGLGVTGFANASEILGFSYGSEECKGFANAVMGFIRDEVYRASIQLAKEKGPFPYYDKHLYPKGSFIQTLPSDIRDDLRTYGIRNSHLLSIAPTGTISLGADNVSSGLEPPFRLEFQRKITTFDGTTTETVKDYAYNFYGVRGRTADDVSVRSHVSILNIFSKYVDSACSKTCNVGASVSWEEFEQVYMDAYEGGASGCTTFRDAGHREGVLTDIGEVKTEQTKTDETEIDGSACYIDPETGIRSCE